MPVIAEIQKGVQVPVRLNNDIATPAAVTSVGNPIALIFIAVKALAATSACASPDINLGVINEHAKRLLFLLFLAELTAGGGLLSSVKIYGGGT